MRELIYKRSRSVFIRSTQQEITFDQNLRRRLSSSVATVAEDMHSAEAALVWSLRPVTFRAIDAVEGPDKEYGLVPEEVASVDESLVFWEEDGEGQRRAKEVDYEQVVSLLLHGMRALKAAREADAARIIGLEAKLNDLLR